MLAGDTQTPRSTSGVFTAGGYGAGDPPDPIPNSEVKTRCADGTAGATRWESTPPPASLDSNARLDLHDRGGRCCFLYLRSAMSPFLCRARRRRAVAPATPATPA